jgi:hypothetical protein
MRSASSWLCRASTAGVDEHAVALDALQHRGHRHLDLFVDKTQARLGLDARPQRLVHVQRHLAVFAAEYSGGALDVDLRERDLVAPLPHRSS